MGGLEDMFIIEKKIDVSDISEPELHSWLDDEFQLTDEEKYQELQIQKGDIAFIEMKKQNDN